jgi:UDP-2,3-diacylglucosamine pyrophosphatase LpxH
MSKRRKVDVLVLSDIHLGTYGCHATELLQYLKSIKPEKVVLNGDIIDIWQFSKSYWPKSHMKIVKHIFGWISKGIPVHYICGNHDEMLRKFDGFEIGSLSIKNKLVIELDNKKSWIFHGDVFDVTMQHSKWLAKLGAIGYDTLILINTFVNFFSVFFGFGKLSFSKKIKNSVKGAVKFINNFEQTVAEIAIEKEYDYVLCGHIHRPEKKNISNSKGSVTYLNSGDWVENLSSLEYYNKEWVVNYFTPSALDDLLLDDYEQYENMDLIDKSSDELFKLMFNEFAIKK